MEKTLDLFAIYINPEKYFSLSINKTYTGLITETKLNKFTFRINNTKMVISMLG